MELNVVRIYRFVDPSFLVKEPILLHIYLGIPAIHDPEAQKTVIDPYSGHFAIADNSFDTDPELDHSVHVPQTEAQARKAVETVITSAEKRRKEHYALVQRKFPNLFANILFAGAQPVLDQERRLIRQWEVRYQPHVNPSREEARVPVMNGSVVFRIGPGDRLVGLAYNWMPIETSEGATTKAHAACSNAFLHRVYDRTGAEPLRALPRGCAGETGHGPSTS